jgi:hypothetical protein
MFETKGYSMQFLLPVTLDNNEEQVSNTTPERLKELETVVFETFSSTNQSSFGQYGCSTSKLDQEQRVFECRVIQIPKFKIECGSTQMGAHMNNIGVKDARCHSGRDAFSPSDEDFSGVSKQHELSISAIIRKEFIEVVESGTTVGIGDPLSDPISQLTTFAEFSSLTH